MLKKTKNPPKFLHRDGKNCYEKEITCFQVISKCNYIFLTMKTYPLLFQKKIYLLFEVEE